MVNIPLVTDKLGLRVVGYHRNEDGYIDNVGTGAKNSNQLKDSGRPRHPVVEDQLSGSASGCWVPTRTAIRRDASLTNPTLGERKRCSTRPDLYTSKTQIYNATVDYDFDAADLTSSSTYSIADGFFSVDLAGTFAGRFRSSCTTNIKRERSSRRRGSCPTRATATIDWVVGGFYLHRDLDLVGVNQSSPEFLARRRITGLPADATFTTFGSDTRTYELAGFGELSYHFTDKLSVTGGLRYGKYGGTVDTDAGFNTDVLRAGALAVQRGGACHAFRPRRRPLTILPRKERRGKRA